MQGSAKKFIAYLRMPTNQKVGSGLGFQTQQKTVRDYLNRSYGGDWILFDQFTEHESARVYTRPELGAALTACKENKCTLIIAGLNRLTRNARFLMELVESNVPVVFCDLPRVDRAMGKDSLTQMLAIAELEASMISERTKAGLAAAKERGVTLGSPDPMKGSVIGVKAIRDGAERRAKDVLPIINEIKNSGATSLRAIANELNARGVSTARGGRWGPSSVRNVLARGNH